MNSHVLDYKILILEVEFGELSRELWRDFLGYYGGQLSRARLYVDGTTVHDDDTLTVTGKHMSYLTLN